MKADLKPCGQYLGGKAPFQFLPGESGELVPHEAEQGLAARLLLYGRRE
jgi:hypothetical protein